MKERKMNIIKQKRVLKRERERRDDNDDEDEVRSKKDDDELGIIKTATNEGFMSSV